MFLSCPLVVATPIFDAEDSPFQDVQTQLSDMDRVFTSIAKIVSEPEQRFSNDEDEFRNYILPSGTNVLTPMTNMKTSTDCDSFHLRLGR